MRGAASVPLGPYIAMRGTDPVCVFAKFWSDRSEELPRKHKDQQKATKRNLTIVARRFFKQGAPHLRQGIPSVLRAHSQGVDLAIDHPKMKGSP